MAEKKLRKKYVYSVETNGKHIVVINVPRADRSYRPVYIDGNPLNTYRRNGEGDCKCTHEEYQAMVRDASVKTQDMLVLTGMDLHPRFYFYLDLVPLLKTCISLCECTLGRIHIRRYSLKRYLFAPYCV